MGHRMNSVEKHSNPFGVSRRDMFQLVGSGMVSAGLAGCAAPLRVTAVPRGKASMARVLGLENERYYPLIAADAAAIEREFLAAVDRSLNRAGVSDRSKAPAYEILSISGGGENGAFGAGLLCGWSEQGKRPVFNLVTGISTGALTAPFAFLGSAYDDQLRSVYTETTAADILVARYFISALYD